MASTEAIALNRNSRTRWVRWLIVLVDPVDGECEYNSSMISGDAERVAGGGGRDGVPLLPKGNGLGRHLTLYGDTGGGGVFFLVGVFLGEAGGEGSLLAGLSNTITWFVSADSITTMGFALDPSTGAKGLGGLLSCC